MVVTGGWWIHDATDPIQRRSPARDIQSFLLKSAPLKTMGKRPNLPLKIEVY